MSDRGRWANLPGVRRAGADHLRLPGLRRPSQPALLRL